MIDPYTLPDDLPAPVDDGAADHLPGARLPAGLALDGDRRRRGRARRARGSHRSSTPTRGPAGPGEPLLVDDWDLIPGARGCTPETCGFRDHHARAPRGRAPRPSTGSRPRTSDYQRELAARLGLPFAILSDADLALTRALALPTFEAAGETLIRRLTLLLDAGRVERVWYPVFPPDRHASEVLAWLRAN